MTKVKLTFLLIALGQRSIVATQTPSVFDDGDLDGQLPNLFNGYNTTETLESQLSTRSIWIPEGNGLTNERNSAHFGISKELQNFRATEVKNSGNEQARTAQSASRVVSNNTLIQLSKGENITSAAPLSTALGRA